MAGFESVKGCHTVGEFRQLAGFDSLKGCLTVGEFLQLASFDSWRVESHKCCQTLGEICHLASSESLKFCQTLGEIRQLASYGPHMGFDTWQNFPLGQMSPLGSFLPSAEAFDWFSSWQVIGTLGKVAKRENPPTGPPRQL